LNTDLQFTPSGNQANRFDWIIWSREDIYQGSG